MIFCGAARDGSIDAETYSGLWTFDRRDRRHRAGAGDPRERKGTLYAWRASWDGSADTGEGGDASVPDRFRQGGGYSAADGSDRRKWAGRAVDDRWYSPVSCERNGGAAEWSAGPPVRRRLC